MGKRKDAPRFYVLVHERVPYLVFDGDTGEPHGFASHAEATENGQRGHITSHVGYSVLEWNDGGLVEVHDA